MLANTMDGNEYLYFFRVLVDLNRAGQPLMELVFAPDLRDGEEAAALVKELSLILLRLGTCNCRMEGGFCSFILYILIIYRIILCKCLKLFCLHMSGFDCSCEQVT